MKLYQKLNIRFYRNDDKNIHQSSKNLNSEEVKLTDEFILSNVSQNVADKYQKQLDLKKMQTEYNFYTNYKYRSLLCIF